MSSGFLFCFLEGCLKAFTPWRKLIVLTLSTIICLPNCRVSDRITDRRVQKAKYRIYPLQHNIDSNLFPLDTHLRAHQITEPSSFFCFKMFYQPRKPELLIDSQMIVCLLCTWLCAGGTATSFWGNKRILRSWFLFPVVCIYCICWQQRTLKSQMNDYSVIPEDCQGDIFQGGYETYRGTAPAWGGDPGTPL